MWLCSTLFLILRLALPVQAVSRGVAGSTMSAAPEARNSTPFPPYDPIGVRIEYRVKMPVAMERAVKAYDPEFKIWDLADYSPKHIRSYPFSLQSTPSAVVSDFNGDGKLDAVLAGRNRHGPEVVAVMSEGAGYRVIRVHSSDYFDIQRRKGEVPPAVAYDMLTFAPNGKRYDLGGDAERKEFKLQSDGFEDAELNVYNPMWWAGTTLYWWLVGDSRFHSGGVYSEEPR